MWKALLSLYALRSEIKGCGVRVPTHTYRVEMPRASLQSTLALIMTACQFLVSGVTIQVCIDSNRQFLAQTFSA